MDESISLGRGELLWKTEKAIKVDTADFDTLWIPQDQLHDDSEVHGGSERFDQGEIIVRPDWWAREQGYIDD